MNNVYYAFALDDKLRKSTSSGGIFPIIASEILASGGYVYGAAYDSCYKVFHLKVCNKEMLERIQGSKYVQSNLEGAYISIREDLLHEKTVLFSGTPCQVAGLISYLSGESVDMSSLITVELICHGVPSPEIWREYITSLQQDVPITNINFCDKLFGWNKRSFCVSYDDGTVFRESQSDNAYMKAFTNDLMLRPSCYQCQFVGVGLK